MVTYAEDGSQSDFLRNIPQAFWVESGYGFEEGSVWEPTPDSFDDHYGNHEAIVAHMLNQGLRAALMEDSLIPEFWMSGVSTANLRGVVETELAQRIGFNVSSKGNLTQVNFSYDIVRPSEIRGFNDNPAVGLSDDVAPGKKHNAKLQLVMPRSGDMEIHYQGYPILNRPFNEHTRMAMNDYVITDRVNPYLGIRSLGAKLILSKLAAYIKHFKAA